jgi:hypothetical protein
MRRPQPSECDSVRALIETVANETFSDLFAPNPVPLKFEDEDWPLAWVAVSDEKIVGVIITNQSGLATCGYFTSTEDKVLEANCSRRVRLRSLPVATRRAPFASFSQMRLPCNSISVRGGRLRVSSRTRSIIMPSGDA